MIFELYRYVRFLGTSDPKEFDPPSERVIKWKRKSKHPCCQEEFIICSIFAIICGVWLSYDLEAVNRIRQHFDTLVDVISIIFGFALTSLLFYIEAFSRWSRRINEQAVARRIIDGHVWTVLSLLGLLGYIFILWGFGRYCQNLAFMCGILYGILGGYIIYCGLQIVSHTLVVRWAFYRRDTLEDISSSSPENREEVPSNET